MHGVWKEEAKGQKKFLVKFLLSGYKIWLLFNTIYHQSDGKILAPKSITSFFVF